MKKIVIVNGIIAGLIVSAVLLISHPLVEKGTVDIDSGMWLGYAAMVLAFSMVFVGIRSYRDQVLGGVIRFGQAFLVGLMITLIASLIYAVTWDIYYRTAATDFTEQYTAHYIEKMKEEGASQEEIASMQKEMDDFGEMYKNFFVRFGFTLMEIVPVGLAVSLISALILKRQTSPAPEQA